MANAGNKRIINLNYIKVIDRIKNDKEVSRLEITSMYRRLYDKVLSNVILDKDVELNAQNIAKQFAEVDTNTGNPGISA